MVEVRQQNGNGEKEDGFSVCRWLYEAHEMLSCEVSTHAKSSVTL